MIQASPITFPNNNKTPDPVTETRASHGNYAKIKIKIKINQVGPAFDVREEEYHKSPNHSPLPQNQCMRRG